MKNNKSIVTILICVVFLGVLIFFVWNELRPLVTAPFEKKVVKKIFYSLMDIAEEEYGNTPIKNLREPQPIIDFVRSFESPSIFRDKLEQAFAENGYSYPKTLHATALDGLNIIMDTDGGAGMVILMTMPSRSIKRQQNDSYFFGQVAQDYKAVLDLYDRYLCCEMIYDF